MHRSLALDLARVAGAAWRDSCGGVVTQRFQLGKATDKRAKLLSRLFDEVEALLDEVQPSLVSVEDDTGQFSKVTRTLRAYHAVIELCCGRRDIAFRVDICASRARALALGDGGLSKEGAARLAGAVYGITGGPDEVDAAILLIATERALDQERLAAAVKPAARKRTTKKRAA